MFRGSVTSPRSLLADTWLCRGLSGRSGPGHSFLGAPAPSHSHVAPTCPPGSCLPPAHPLAAPVVPAGHPCLAALLCGRQQPSCLLWPGHLEAETPCPVWRGPSQPGTKSLAAQQVLVASEGRAGPCAGGVDRVEARWWCRGGLRGAAGSLDGGLEAAGGTVLPWCPGDLASSFLFSAFGQCSPSAALRVASRAL